MSFQDIIYCKGFFSKYLKLSIYLHLSKFVLLLLSLLNSGSMCKNGLHFLMTDAMILLDPMNQSWNLWFSNMGLLNPKPAPIWKQEIITDQWYVQLI